MDKQKNTIVFHKYKESAHIADRLWIYLKPLLKKEIQKGETLRFGKQTMKLKDIHLPNKKHKNKSNEGDVQHNSKYSSLNDVNIIKNSKIECRICLDNDSDANPFINLCECSKSMPIHLNCIKMWLQKKCEAVERKNMIIYDIKNIKCEVCNQIYPMDIYFNGQNINLFTTEADIARSYAVIEIYELNTINIKSIVVIYTDVPKFKLSIGRSATNDFVFADISVSRKHAELIFRKNKIFVKDCKSKFGSHVEYNEMPLSYNKKAIHLQIQKFYLKFHPHKRKYCYCSKPNKKQWIRDPVSAISDIEKEFNIKIFRKKNQTTNSNNTIENASLNHSSSYNEKIKEEKQSQISEENLNDFTYNQDKTGIYIDKDMSSIIKEENQNNNYKRYVSKSCAILRRMDPVNYKKRYYSNDIKVSINKNNPIILSQLLMHNNQLTINHRLYTKQLKQKTESNEEHGVNGIGAFQEYSNQEKIRNKRLDFCHNKLQNCRSRYYLNKSEQDQLVDRYTNYSYIREKRRRYSVD